MVAIEITHNRGDILMVPRGFSRKGYWVTWLITFTNNNGQVATREFVAHKSRTKKDLRAAIEKMVDAELSLEAKYGRANAVDTSDEMDTVGDADVLEDVE
jgi:acetolactate synthase regulatory subunit